MIAVVSQLPINTQVALCFSKVRTFWSGFAFNRNKIPKILSMCAAAFYITERNFIYQKIVYLPYLIKKGVNELNNSE